ncbi:glycosyltransferase family 2 protein [Chloroflexi bacterium TSY]|nr:glycosyltransferase family 2 protein [Chloroflexi bacterium TSY]
MDRNQTDYQVSVIVPVYNEESTIRIILSKVCQIDLVKEVIVVNDGSTDSTSLVIQRLDLPKVRLIEQEHNQGKTAAIRRGLSEVTGAITIFQDADLEYDPDEIESVVRPIIENKADIVYGSRFLVRRATRVLYYYHYLANKFLTFLSNLLTNVNMTDMETCYKAFLTPLIQQLPLTSHGFGLEVEITAIMTKTHARIYEVPISYYGRTYEEGKKINYKDGLAALWYIFYYNLVAPKTRRRKVYIDWANSFLRQWKENRVLERDLQIPFDSSRSTNVDLSFTEGTDHSTQILYPEHCNQ